MAARRVTGAFAAATLLFAGAAAAVTVTDDRGMAIALDRAAARVVTLSPHLTELVYAAGAGRALVGVPLYSDYPEAAKAVPRIGDATRVDLERVLALQPDLVLAWKSGNSAADIARLERLGLRVYVSDAPRLGDVSRVIRTLGTLAGTSDDAQRAARAYEEEIDRLRTRYAGDAPVRVFYQIWDRPLLTVNGRHLISDVLRLCGGINVFADARLLTPSVSLESLIAARPQAILGGSSGMTPAQFDAQWRAREIPALSAVPVRYVSPDFIQRPTPRIAAGAQAICRQLADIRSSMVP